MVQTPQLLFLVRRPFKITLYVARISNGNKSSSMDYSHCVIRLRE
jgi:hypothetical protein